MVYVPDEELTGDLDSDLGMIFHYGQNDIQPRKAWSVSVDDIIDYHGTFYKVTSTGFLKLEI
jgi:hypothetical protein